MTFKSVKYIGQFEAEEYARKLSVPEIMISITDIKLADLQYWDECDLLRLEFIDVEVIDKFCFTKEMANQIIDFVNRFENKPNKDEIIVHCFAGVSRSAGVAKWIAEKYDLDFKDEYNDYNKMVYNILKYEDSNKCQKEHLEDTTLKD
jgi:predicted protein tyrosine phosphatase